MEPILKAQNQINYRWHIALDEWPDTLHQGQALNNIKMQVWF